MKFIIRTRLPRTRPADWLRVVATIVVLAPVVITSCAYYNLFYNARNVYDDAQKIPVSGKDEPNRAADQKYDQVIEKCQNLIRLYPDSKWVDDAILLMAKSYYYKGDYSDAITKFNELEENFPESKLNEEGTFFLGKSYADSNEPERAIATLERLLEKHKRTRYSEEALFIMGTSAIKAELEDDAVRYLARLAKKHPSSPYRVEADLVIAEIFMDRDRYDRALEVFDKLGQTKLKGDDEARYKLAMLRTYVKIGMFMRAIGVSHQLDALPLEDVDEASKLLFRAEAYAGVDSVWRSIDTYKMVRGTFPSSKFSAEAAFKMGVLYQEKLDSLDVAATQFDAVPRQYSKSEFAPDAIRRSSSIKNLKRLQASIEQGAGADKSGLKFDLAEVELFQFANYRKALGLYQEVLTDYPNSDLAPRAAYAVAYIYESQVKDDEQARQAYQRVVDDYPNSEQATYARASLTRLGVQSSAVTPTAN